MRDLLKKSIVFLILPQQGVIFQLQLFLSVIQLHYSSSWLVGLDLVLCPQAAIEDNVIYIIDWLYLL